LTLAAQPEYALVADCIAADRFAGLDEKQIAELPVVHGGRPATLGEFFKVARRTRERGPGSGGDRPTGERHRRPDGGW